MIDNGLFLTMWDILSYFRPILVWLHTFSGGIQVCVMLLSPSTCGFGIPAWFRMVGTVAVPAAVGCCKKATLSQKAREMTDVASAETSIQTLCGLYQTFVSPPAGSKLQELLLSSMSCSLLPPLPRLSDYPSILPGQAIKW